MISYVCNYRFTVIIMPFATIVSFKYGTIFCSTISKEKSVVMIVSLSISKTTIRYFRSWKWNIRWSYLISCFSIFLVWLKHLFFCICNFVAPLLWSVHAFLVTNICSWFYGLMLSTKSKKIVIPQTIVYINIKINDIMYYLCNTSGSIYRAGIAYPFEAVSVF